jgi:hypothetical protein
MFSIWATLLLYLPADLWMDYEYFYIPDSWKVTDGYWLFAIRIMSWVVNFYSLFVAFGFVGQFLADYFFFPNLQVPEMFTIGEFITSAIAVLTGVSYFFQVYSYLPYF